MRRTSRLVLLAGVFLAAITFIVIVLLFQGGPGNPGGPTATTPTTAQVVVANVDIPLGTTIDASMVDNQTVSVQAVAPGAHAAVLIDGAGYHIAGDLTVPNNITLVRLPSYSPELNAIEKLWQVMRENILSHRLFDSLDHIIDVCCDAWNRILAEPGRIRSTCGYRWASQVKI